MTAPSGLHNFMAERFGQDLVLLEKLAAGGMAEVYRAKQHGYAGFEKTVALKRILQNYAQNEEFKNMFRLEANLSGQLQHPNVVQVFGNGEFDGYLYLLMEFVDGRNVRQILARADKRKIKIPIEFALYIVSEASKGLDYAHDFHDEKTGQHLEIVHRDMSPQNIMVGYEGHVKIVDFGIAKAAARSGQTRAGVLKGKFGYMSPEQAQGMTIDRRTDIFALGIILFELLTQRRLFTAEDDLKTLQLVKEARVPRPSKYNPDVSPALDAIVLKALAREKSDRYDKASEFYAEITRFLVQNFPKFLPMDFAKWIKEIFSEDIKEEKKRREKINAELPARFVEPQVKKNSPSEAATDLLSSDEGPTATGKTPITKTEISKSSEAHTEASSPNLIARGVDIAKAPSLPVPPLNRPDFPSGPPVGAATQPLKLKISTKENNDSGLPKIDTQTDYVEPPNPHLTQISTPRNERITDKKPLAKRKGLGWPAKVAAVTVILAAVWELGLNSKLNSPDSQIADNSEQIDSRSPSTDPGESSIGFGEPVPSAVPNSTLDPENTKPKESNQSSPSIAKNESIPDAPLNLQKGSSSFSSPDLSQKNPKNDPAPVEGLSGTSNPKESGQTIPLKPSERPVKKEGYITIISTPEANEIILNGRRMEDQNGNPLRTPLRNFPLEAGEYTIELRNSFFGVSYKEKLKLDPDRFKTLDVILKK